MIAFIYPCNTQLKKAIRVTEDITMLPQHQAKFLVNFFSKDLRSSLVAKFVIHTTLFKKNFKAAIFIRSPFLFVAAKARRVA